VRGLLTWVRRERETDGCGSYLGLPTFDGDTMGRGEWLGVFFFVRWEVEVGTSVPEDKSIDGLYVSWFF
jgi:hypothetical protein